MKPLSPVWQADGHPSTLERPWSPGPGARRRLFDDVMERDGAFDGSTGQERGQLAHGRQHQPLRASSADPPAAAAGLLGPLPLGHGLRGRRGAGGGEPVDTTLALDDGRHLAFQQQGDGGSLQDSRTNTQSHTSL